MKNYTPGPWSVTIFESGGKPIVQRGDSGGFQVSGFCTKTQNADARLISAAPDLLEALEDAVSWFCQLDDWSGVGDPNIGKYKAAIAKAKGE